MALLACESPGLGLLAACAVFAVLLAPVGACVAERYLPEGPTADGIARLEESLAEGLGNGDGEIIDRALAQLAPLGLGERELLWSVDNAALSAAAVHPGEEGRIRIDVWALAVKAKLGDDRARGILHSWARQRLQLPEGVREVEDRAWYGMQTATERRAKALPGLAYLGEEDVTDLAKAFLRCDLGRRSDDIRRRAVERGLDARERHYQSYRRAVTQQRFDSQAGVVMSFLLKRDYEEGLRHVFSLLHDGEFRVGYRIRILDNCATLIRDDPEAVEGLVACYEPVARALAADVVGLKDVPIGARRIAQVASDLRRLVRAASWDLPPDKKTLAALEIVREAVEAAPPGRLAAQEVNRVINSVMNYRQRLAAEEQKPARGRGLRPGPVDILEPKGAETEEDL